MPTKTARILVATIAALFALSILATIGIPRTSSAAPATSAGTSYYVSPDGSDSNDGRSASSPVKTIQKAIDAAQPGDTVNLGAGTYQQDVQTTRNGTADAPITVTGPSSAIIKGAGDARIFEVNHDYMVLDGFTIDGQVNSSTYRDKLLYVHGIQPRDGVTGLKAQHLTLRNAGGECFRLRYFVQRSEISDNAIGPCGRDDFPNGVWGGGKKNGEGIYMGTAPEQRADGKNPTADPDLTTDNWVHNNTFNTQGNECVDIKEAATRNLVENNNCTGQKDPESGGFDIRGNGNVFRNNETYGNVGMGFRIGGDTPADGINNDVYGNSIHDNKNGGIRFQRAPQHMMCNNTMANNTGGNSVGDFAKEFDPTTKCSSSPASQPTNTPAVSPTRAATSAPSTTAVPPKATSVPTAAATATAPSNPAASPTATAQPTQGGTSYAAQADTYIAKGSSKSYGSKTILKLDGSPETWTLIRFQLPAGQTVKSAQLRLFVKDVAALGGRVSVVTGAWNEQTTWDTRPTLGATVANIGKLTKNAFVTVDVTSALQPDGTVSLAIQPLAKDSATYSSREGDASKAPQLIISR